ncbi:MAG: hypothetical protein IT560_02085 [Alphaproteobacteria bacterium]|jgi:Spy/CpxP family protein refolding chaperone|nr:hypothetical protein [Alphaproteobacteria bacterium]
MLNKMMIAALAMTVMTAGAARAEEPSGGPGPDGGKGSPEKFQEHKQKILQKIDARIAESQKRRACVAAASDVEALKACMPERRGGHEGGGMMRRKRDGGGDSAQ